MIHRRLNRYAEFLPGALALVSGILIVALLAQQYLQARDSLTGRELARHELTWKATERLLDERAAVWFDAFANQPPVRDILRRAQDPQQRDQARAELVDYLAPLQAAMQAVGASILHFHLPEGSEFLPLLPARALRRFGARSSPHDSPGQ